MEAIDLRSVVTPLRGVMPATETGRNLVQLITYEAKRRPEIAALIERAGTLTDADIATADVPLPWYRLALAMIRDRAVTQQRMQHAAETIDDFVVASTVADPEGETRTYRGPTAFFRTGRSELEIQTDTLFFLPDDGGMWIGSSFCEVVDHRLIAHSETVERTTRQRYREAHQERLQRAFPNPPMTVNCDEPVAATGPSSQPLAHLGVRIQR